jgi:hypothetical protein
MFLLVASLVLMLHTQSISPSVQTKKIDIDFVVQNYT